MKKIVSLILSLVFIVGCSVSAMAAEGSSNEQSSAVLTAGNEESGIMPIWEPHCDRGGYIAVKTDRHVVFVETGTCTHGRSGYYHRRELWQNVIKYECTGCHTSFIHTTDVFKDPWQCVKGS
ncbi:MAG: hypothetical protein HFH30_14425 [Eubacterium sp.]|nr:hypothetical protein [Eubacterium sp.]MCI8918642.1 hypothetical protein [Eubacterium sp.]